jgi:hypothetical protein
VGPIVGGVVGGVAGLALLGLAAWFLMRCKRNDSNNSHRKLHEVSYEVAVHDGFPLQQLDAEQVVHEAGDGKTRYAHAKELPANEVIVELHGDSPSP